MIFTVSQKMNLAAFQSFVDSHPDLFAGVNPESRESLADAERVLGCSLPETLKWLLESHGYSFPCGISSLRDSVSTTLRCRAKLFLSPDIIVLNDWGDAGIVYWDSKSGLVYWGDASDLNLLADGKEIPRMRHVYDGYSAWVKARMEDEIEEELA